MVTRHRAAAGQGEARPVASKTRPRRRPTGPARSSPSSSPGLVLAVVVVVVSTAPAPRTPPRRARAPRRRWPGRCRGTAGAAASAHGHDESGAPRPATGHDGHDGGPGDPLGHRPRRRPTTSPTAAPRSQARPSPARSPRWATRSCSTSSPTSRRTSPGAGRRSGQPAVRDRHRHRPGRPGRRHPGHVLVVELGTNGSVTDRRLRRHDAGGGRGEAGGVRQRRRAPVVGGPRTIRSGRRGGPLPGRQAVLADWYTLSTGPPRVVHPRPGPPASRPEPRPWPPSSPARPEPVGPVGPTGRRPWPPGPRPAPSGSRVGGRDRTGRPACHPVRPTTWRSVPTSPPTSPSWWPAAPGGR